MQHWRQNIPLILADVLPAFPCHPPANTNRQVSIVPSILPPSVASPSLLSKSIVLRNKTGRRSWILGAIGHLSLSAWSFCQDPIFCIIIFMGCNDMCFQVLGQCEVRCEAMLYDVVLSPYLGISLHLRTSLQLVRNYGCVDLFGCYPLSAAQFGVPPL